MLRAFVLICIACAVAAFQPVASVASRSAVRTSSVEMGAKKGKVNPALFSSGIDPKVIAKNKKCVGERRAELDADQALNDMDTGM